jgi:hypothetical protein
MTPPRRPVASLLPCCAAAALPLLIAGCSGTAPKPADPVSPTVDTPPPIRPAPLVDGRPRIDVPAGATIIIPLTPTDAAALRRERARRQALGEPLVATSDDGQRFPASIVRIATRATDDAIGNAAALHAAALHDRWLGDPGTWSAHDDSPGQDSAPGVPALLIDFAASLDSADPSSTTTDRAPRIRIGDAWSAPLQWLPSRERLIRASDGVESPWRPVLDEVTRTEPAALNAIAVEAESPITRWRWRLLVDGLDPARADDATAPAPFADRAIEALARQNEDRWRVALAWLWFADASVAQRVKHRVAAVARFATPGVAGPSTGRLAPIWTTDHAVLDQLLADLLDPRADPATRVALARRWLDEQPPAAAWVHDDGGVLVWPSPDARATPTATTPASATTPAPLPAIVATIGVVNLLDRPTLAWTSLGVPDPAPDLVPVPSMAGTLLSRPITRDLANTRANSNPSPVPAPDATLEAHLGSLRVPLPVRAAPTPATPPGVPLGPLRQDWTMRRFQGEPDPRGSSLGIEWSAGALLHRAPAGSPSRWEVFVESRTPAPNTNPNPDATANESVTLYFGPSGAPRAVVRVSRDGAAVASGPASTAFPTSVAIAQHADRWTFRLPVPAQVIDEGDIVRIGLTRSDALGRRWAFPHAMLPWEIEPARLAIDLAAWGR